MSKYLYEKIIRLHKEGKNRHEIEELSGASRNYIQKVVSKVFGDRTTLSKSRVNPRLITDMYESGLTCEEIAKELGICRIMTCNLVREHLGVDRLPSVRGGLFAGKNKKPNIRDTIIDLTRQGVSCTMIAKRLNLTPGSVKFYLDRILGKPVRRKRRKTNRPRRRRDDSKDQLIIKLYLSGTPVSKIPASGETLKRIRQLYDIPPRRLTDDEMEKRSREIMRLFEKYKNKSLVAKRMGIKRGTVAYVINTHAKKSGSKMS